jgi:integrase
MKKPMEFPIQIKRGNVTVKVYRTVAATGYASYQVADYSSGFRRLVSLSNLEDARQRALSIADKMNAGEKEVLALRGEDAASFVRATAALKTTGVSLEHAVSAFVESFDLLGGNRVTEAARFFAKRNPARLPQKIVREVVDELIKAKEGGGLGARYVADLRYRLGRFADDFCCSIGAIDGGQIQDWMDKLNLSPRSQINFRRVIGTLFEFAKRRGYLPKDHDEIDRLEKVKARAGAIAIYKPADMARLLAATPKEFLPCLVIAAFCGLRSAEIEKLDWREVHLAERFIEVTAGKAKTKTRRLAPIPDNAAGWLSSYLMATGPVWRGSHDDFYDAQQATAAATEVKANAKRRIAGVPALEWKANATRHSFISYRLAQIQNVNQVAMEAGNSAGIIHSHYKELVRPSDAVAWFGIAPSKPANVTNIAAA